jgi:hypothetical protein
MLRIAGCSRQTQWPIPIYNDFTAYHAAVTTGKPAIINRAFGAFLVLLGAPVFLIYKARHKGQ